MKKLLELMKSLMPKKSSFANVPSHKATATQRVTEDKWAKKQIKGIAQLRGRLILM